jgi:hypothetical protein
MYISYKYLFLLFIIVVGFSCSTGKTASNGNSKNIIAGEVSWQYWKANAGWVLYEAFDYFPNPTDIEKFKKLLDNKNYSFLIFATTFCDECEHNIPKLFKVFETAKIPENRIRLFGLDERLSEPSGEFTKYNIPSTPVAYILIDDKVIGEAAYPYRWLDNFIEILEANSN